MSPVENKKWLSEIILEGNIVRLELLKTSHNKALIEAASDGKLWELWYTSIPSSKTINSYIDQALQQYHTNTGFPFVVIDQGSGQVIGSTRYLNATSQHRRLEIGSTWYAGSFQGTGVNTECKYLLLKYAFEKLDCIAVEFRTHWHNTKSRDAISRLGAKQDGVMRNHRIMNDGSFRDTVVFSIVKEEWTSVQRSLEFKLGL